MTKLVNYLTGLLKMLNKIRQQIGAIPEMLPEEQNSDMMDEFVPEPTEDFETMEPDDILKDPSSSMDLKKFAMKQIKDRYLKPREDNNER
jgi:hypothetical protein